MALTIANECRKAALDAILALLNNGQFLLQTAGAAEIAILTFAATAYQAASTASPSSATSNAITKDSTITPGTIGLFAFRTSGAAARISGTVGVGSGDLQVSDNVVPANATEVTCDAGLTVTLQLA